MNYFFSFQVTCAIIAGFLHFFFLTSFAWMCLEGIQLYFMLIEVFEAERSRVRWFYAFGYGKLFLPTRKKESCWFENICSRGLFTICKSNTFRAIGFQGGWLWCALIEYLRNEFHFSGVHGAMNRSGSRAKWMNPEGVHVSFASDPLRFIAP